METTGTPTASLDGCTDEPPRRFHDSELVIGLIGATGSDLVRVSAILETLIKKARYKTRTIRISREVIPLLVSTENAESMSAYDRALALMDAGNHAREVAKQDGVLAMGAASLIWKLRDRQDVEGTDPKTEPLNRHAFILNSLKHPQEVEWLRTIYPLGFYLIGVFSDESLRVHELVDVLGMSNEQANRLMELDQNDRKEHGQRVADTFHLSDFFVRSDASPLRLKNSLERVVKILFGEPYQTPTFDEYAMYLAYTASLRSADLSRQVGAVVAKGREVLALGANECPRAGGGLYWPEIDEETGEVVEAEQGRDFTRGYDANKQEQRDIIEKIVLAAADRGLDPHVLRESLQNGPVADLTEFGRMIHAEMEALLSCSRRGIDAREASIYCTTFPCHNCAKHIVASGIREVVYVEPYAKSKAGDLHNDSIRIGFDSSGVGDDSHKVRFRPFVGVGPRRFFDFFSKNLGSGRELVRKDKQGKKVAWDLVTADSRLQMLPSSYLDIETRAARFFQSCVRQSTEKG